MKIIEKGLNKCSPARKIQISVLCLLAALCLPCLTYSQSTVSLEIRPRAEFRNGFKKLISETEKPAFFIEQRSRVNFSMKGEKISASIRLQDVRIWGETGQINKSDNLFSVHEAWAQYSFSKKLALKAGRQELVYDDHRILGNLDWAAQGRSHDAVKLAYSDSAWTFHLAGAYNQNSTIAEPSKLTGNFYNSPGSFLLIGGGLPNYKHMQMLWAERSAGKFSTSFLFLNTGWQMPDTTTNNLTTIGINPQFTFTSKLKLLGTFYYQTGEDRLNAKVNSWLISLSLNLNRLASTHFIGFDQLSGTKADATRSNTFDPLFGTHHKFYGLMDYFYVGNPHVQMGKTIGLRDFFLRSKYNLSQKTALSTELHHFSSPVKILDPQDNLNTLSFSLGTEADLVLQHNFSKEFILHLGYSQMFATKSMEAIKGGSRDQLNMWAWLMLTFKPELLNIERK
jgi:hypothetical protein